MTNIPAAELRSICKHFGPVKANDQLCLSVYRGEIHAILGENGCGKSTLMNILSGLYTPDSGDILLDGKKVVFSSPRDAMKHGIGMIHQRFKLAEPLRAWENIAGGVSSALFCSHTKAVEKIRELCGRYGLELDPEKVIADMTIGEKQTVEIVKALYRGADLLILDEPTAVLTVQETARLFGILREMKAAGKAIILITHKLGEVMAVSDRVTVLRKGQNISSCLTSETDASALAEQMIGRSVDITVPFVSTPDEMKKPVLELKDLILKGSNGRHKLDVPELTVHAGEILGVAGVADSGQRQLCESIAGFRPKTTGSVKLNGEELMGMTPHMRVKKGISIAFVPEDALHTGLAGSLSVAENTMMHTYRRGKGPLIDRKSRRSEAEAIVRDYDVSTPSLETSVRSLSGGNIQKILMGREISRGAQVLIAAYPVRGLDIGATNYVYEQLNRQKKAGMAILLIAEDLDTLLGLSDRIAVLCGGRLMGIVDGRTADKAQLGLMMTGLKEDTENVQN